MKKLLAPNFWPRLLDTRIDKKYLGFDPNERNDGENKHS